MVCGMRVILPFLHLFHSSWSFLLTLELDADPMAFQQQRELLQIVAHAQVALVPQQSWPSS